ncbi:hypothetical protein BMF94_3095 [Rhodotorula taiwanensis]|uniref:Uncharacterized protein n=1 Tax=Rhodotorula taiwanensis TaxID=741276 RepID=A0A2S5BAY6_9BASI|nr:hypothetical protein BMF94_3095 [Rhodotorula taiwanensis]
MGKLRKARPTAPGTPAGPTAASASSLSSSSPHDSLRRRTPSIASRSSHGSAPIALKSAAHLETIAVSPAVVSAAPGEPVVTSAASGVIATPGTSATSSPRFYRTRFPSTSTIASSIESSHEPFTPSPALAKLRSRLEFDRAHSSRQSEGPVDSGGGPADAAHDGQVEAVVHEVDTAKTAPRADDREQDGTPPSLPLSTRPLDRPPSQIRVATVTTPRKTVARSLTSPVQLVMSAMQLWLGITLAVLLVAKALVEIALERIARRRRAGLG